MVLDLAPVKASLVSPLLAFWILAILSAGPAAATQTAKPACVIDMGSNTFRRIVGTFENGRYEQRSLEKQSLGVGDDLAKHGRISDAKLAEIAKVLAGFKTSCETDGTQPVVAIGTAAFREASNGMRAVDLAAEIGIRMEVATEARESELAYLVGSLGQDGIAVIDNGSRSIELVSQVGGMPLFRVFSLGYRAAYETFFAAADDLTSATNAFRAQLRQEAQKASFMKGRTKLVGVEFGEMAEIFFPNARVEGRVLTRQDLEKKLDEIAASGREGFQALKQRKDIDRALPRLVVAAALTEAFGYTQIELTDRELGAGLIIEAGLNPKKH